MSVSGATNLTTKVRTAAPATLRLGLVALPTVWPVRLQALH